MTDLFSFLDDLNNLLVGYIACGFILLLGLFFTIKARFFQVKKFPEFIRTFFQFLIKSDKSSRGVHPLKAFFASIGGCIGIGNVVGICLAIQIGGPGALFWTWVAAFFGSLLKYSEVYLGVSHRLKNNQGSYDGGPMYFLPKAFAKMGGGRWVALAVAFLLCIYGVEIYQFRVITESISTNWGVNKLLVTSILLFLVILAGAGGIKAVGKICSAIMPIFLVLYILMGGWILLQHLDIFPTLISQIFTSAFSGQAALGGFVGSTMMMTMVQGVRIGCYSGDIGIGYASVIQSETSTPYPEKQAGLAIFGIFLDTCVICTMSVLLILTTGTWHEPIDSTLLIQHALTKYYPYALFGTPILNLFMPFFLFLLGYSTIIAYFFVGLKCARFIAPKRGQAIYYGYAIFAFLFFSFFDLSHAYSVMVLAGGLLLILNLTGTFLLRKELPFFKSTKVLEPVISEASLSQD